MLQEGGPRRGATRPAARPSPGAGAAGPPDTAVAGVDQALLATTTQVCSVLGWVDFASISMTYSGAELGTLAATDPIALKADAAQYELDEGPTLSAMGGAPLVESADVSTDSRWPSYAKSAGELGIRSQASVRLPTAGGRTGALNLYSTIGHHLDDVSWELAESFAAQAATMVASASRIESLTEALQDRQDISKAIGIVMERFSLDEGAAFDRLVKISQSSQTKVRVLAQRLVEGAHVGWSADRPA